MTKLQYINEIVDRACLPCKYGKKVAADLREEFDTSLERGYSEGEIMARMGEPDDVAAGIYEGYADRNGGSRPFVEYKSKRELFGMPLVHIVKAKRMSSVDKSPMWRNVPTAGGIIAIGRRARGVVAIGNSAVGIIAIGNIAVGLVSLANVGFCLAGAGNFIVGLFAAVANFAVGLCAYGNIAVGRYSFGLVTVGQYSPASPSAVFDIEAAVAFSETLPSFARLVLQLCGWVSSNILWIIPMLLIYLFAHMAVSHRLEKWD